VVVVVIVVVGVFAVYETYYYFFLGEAKQPYIGHALDALL
jgi:hypothetical protein